MNELNNLLQFSKSEYINDYNTFKLKKYKEIQYIERQEQGKQMLDQYEKRKNEFFKKDETHKFNNEDFDNSIKEYEKFRLQKKINK